jgi:ribosomal protein S18 acetylase RimI-like enzyme
MTVAANFRITSITPSRIPGFREVWDFVAREKRYLSVTEAPSEDEVREFVLNNLQVGNPHLLAIVDDKVVGWCDVIRQARATTHHRGVLSVGLLPEVRCMGIGGALIEQVLKLAWANNFKRIDLVARADNVHAVTLYQRHGFEIEGLRHKAFQIDGIFYDLLDMALLHPDLAEADPPR